jgi:hypothetical protein
VKSATASRSAAVSSAAELRQWRVTTFDHPCGAEALAADALGVDHPIRQRHEGVARLHANRGSEDR